MLPQGQRRDDPPSRMSFRFRLALLVRRYPIHIALALALLLVTIPLYFLVRSNDALHDSNARLRTTVRQVGESNGKLASSLKYIQTSRRIISERFCDSMNSTARSTNAQNDYIRSLIVRGAKDSAVFEDLFRQFGAPPYPKRFREARGRARRLGRYKVALLDCQRFFIQIDCEVEALDTGVHPRDCVKARLERDRSNG